MDEILYFSDRDTKLIEFCKNNTTKKTRVAMGIKLGLFKRGPYSMKKSYYPTLVKFYLDWMTSDRTSKLDLRKT